MNLKKEITSSNLEDVVYIYGSKQDVKNIINQCELGVFTSNSEGLPVALLEYGINKKPVVSTNVGQIPFIVEHNKCGLISGVNNVEEFSRNLSKLLSDNRLREGFGEEIYKVIQNNYSEDVVLNKYVSWIKEIKNIKINSLNAE